MATPAPVVDPFAGPSMYQRTTATGTKQNPFAGFQQSGPQVFPTIPLAARTAPTGLLGFAAPDRRIVAGVRPDSQRQFNERRVMLGRSPIIPTQMDPTIKGAEFLFGR